MSRETTESKFFNINDAQFKKKLDFFEQKYEENIARFFRIDWFTKEEKSDLEQDYDNIHSLGNHFKFACENLRFQGDYFNSFLSWKDLTKPPEFTKQQQSHLRKRESGLENIESELKKLVSILRKIVAEVVKKRETALPVLKKPAPKKNPSEDIENVTPGIRKKRLLSQYRGLYEKIREENEQLCFSSKILGFRFMKMKLDAFNSKHNALRELAYKTNSNDTDTVEALAEKLKGSHFESLNASLEFNKAFQSATQIHLDFSEKRNVCEAQYKKLSEAVRQFLLPDLRNAKRQPISRTSDLLYNEIINFELLFASPNDFESIDDFKNALNEKNELCLELMHTLDVQLKALADSRLKSDAEKGSIEDLQVMDNNFQPPGLTPSPLVATSSQISPVQDPTPISEGLLASASQYNSQQFYSAPPPLPSYRNKGPSDEMRRALEGRGMTPSK